MFKNKLKSILGKKTDEETKENVNSEETGKLKESKNNVENKKKMENLIFLAIVLIITIIAINMIWNGADTKKQEIDSKNTSQNGKVLANTEELENEEVVEESSLEKSLEEILKKIQGVGEVNVFINYSESSEVVAMYNENSKTSITEETDTSGGVRKIEETDTQKDVIYEENDGEKTPITQKTIKPKIEGAIITAKGASDANVKTNIIQAVEAVTGLATHKIQVFEME